MTLPKESMLHLVQVLRMKEGDSLTVFNGEGGEFSAVLSQVNNKTAHLEIKAHHSIERESPCLIHVCHGLAKGDKMDWIIQKAVEMGVTRFTPMKTDKCVIKLDSERAEKRTQHWQRIIESSSEQCGRNRLMQLDPIASAQTLLTSADFSGLSVICDPNRSAHSLPQSVPNGIRLFIGGESGFSQRELQWAQHTHIQTYSLGPRVLRTETAAIVAVTRLQSLYGDLS